MPFSPRMVAAIKEKQTKLSPNPMNPQNIAIQTPGTVNPSKLPNPVTAATTSLVHPNIPGIPAPKPGTIGPLRRFQKLKSKLKGK